MTTIAPLPQRQSYEPGPAAFSRHVGRRLVLVAVILISGGLATPSLSALGLPAAVCAAVATATLVLITLAPSTVIYLAATSLEINVVRLAHGKRPAIATAAFSAYATALGATLEPGALGTAHWLSMSVAGWLAFSPLVRHVSRVVFAANVKGPTPFGGLAIAATLFAPGIFFTVSLAWPDTRPAVGAILIGFGAKVMWHAARLVFIQQVESVQGFPFDTGSTKSSGLVSLVRWTERNLNRSLVERAALGYAACQLIYLIPSKRLASFRAAFLHLQIQRDYSTRRYARVLERTTDSEDGILLYLRIRSLIATGQMDHADQLLQAAILRCASAPSPYLYYARARLHLERSGPCTDAYRADLRMASVLATGRLHASASRHICPDALAEAAKARALEVAIALEDRILHLEARRMHFRDVLWEVNQARRIGERHSVRLASEIRAIQGVVEGLAGAHSEAYLALLDALATGENLEARYHLAVLLMVGSATLLRPIYHLERVVGLAPGTSRLGKLARVRLDEALEVWRVNRELTSSWNSFRLVTFSQKYLTMAESVEPAWAALVVREDTSKKKAYRRLFGKEPTESVSGHAAEWIAVLDSLGRWSPATGPSAARDVKVPATSFS